MNKSAHLTVYYDGLCGLCRSEINLYKKIAPKGVFTWHDVAADPAPLEGKPFNRAQALKHLRAEDEHGNIHIGVDAFIEIWKHLPLWKALAWLAGFKPFYWLGNQFYSRFAEWRFKRLTHCQLAAKEENT